VPERLGNRNVHVAELAAVALVEDQDHVPAEDLVAFVRAHEVRQLLDRGDDDPRVRIGQLSCEHRG